MLHFKRKFKRPMHPWEKQRIIEEKGLKEEHAYKNKREIWRMQAFIKKYRDLAKKLVYIRTKQQEKERKELIQKLSNLGLISKEASIDEVLGLTVNDISQRRLQTVLVKRGLAHTTKQARQLISHGHVFIGGRKIKSPSKLVTLKEESLIKADLVLKAPEKVVKKVEEEKMEGVKK